MNPSALNEESLNEEIKRASQLLNEAEKSYVALQNDLDTLEKERERRVNLNDRTLHASSVNALVKRWTDRAGDILRAAEALNQDAQAKHSLLLQRDILLCCILDLEQAKRDCLTTPNHT